MRVFLLMRWTTCRKIRINKNIAIISEFTVYHGENKLHFDDDVHFVLDHFAELDFYRVSSLKQQSEGRHVVPLEHIILIPSQPVFALSP
jgi:hypothetical protein